MIVIKGNPHPDPMLDPEQERLWTAFSGFLIEHGFSPKRFPHAHEWLGAEGRKYRARIGMKEPSAKFGRLAPTPRCIAKVTNTDGGAGATQSAGLPPETSPGRMLVRGWAVG